MEDIIIIISRLKGHEAINKNRMQENFNPSENISTPAKTTTTKNNNKNNVWPYFVSKGI